jgi:UDP-N-acetylmuramate dehydrogenase
LVSADTLAEPQANVPLAPFATLQVGGPAQWFVRAQSPRQVQLAHAWAAERGLPVFILGGGSNVVIAKHGVPGLVLHVTIRGIDVLQSGDEALLSVGAGEPWDPFVSKVVDEGYAGLETLSGIPGLVGGTPIQNVGAYGQEVSTTIESVTVFDTRTREISIIAARDCGFAYRQSRFKQSDAGRFTICGVTFRVRRGSPTVTYPDVMTWVEQNRLSQPAVADVRRGVIEIRRRKGMVLDPADADTRSVGSFFMNPIVAASKQTDLGARAFAMADGRVKIPAAWLIERAGFGKGFAAGAAGLSSKHPLAIVNRGGADADDVVELACRIKRAVLDRFGIALRPEPIFAGFDDDERIHFLQTDTAA